MANLPESIDGLKEARLADSEILEIMFESVDGQMPKKNLQKTKSPTMNFLIRSILKHLQPVRENYVFLAQKSIPK